MLVKYFEQNSDVLFITFPGQQGEIADDKKALSRMASREGYAQHFILKKGFDLVAVVNRKYFFYQNLMRKKFHSIIKDVILKYKRVYMYGSSGGGYAALYYSIGTIAIPIAYSPRVRVDPAAKMSPVPGLPKHVHMPLSKFTSLNRAHIFFDPYHSPDRRFIENRVKPCFLNAIITEVPFAGHGPFYFSEVGLIKYVVESIVTSSNVCLDFSLRKSSLIYHYNLVAWLLKRDKWYSAWKVGVRGLMLVEINDAYARKRKDIYDALMKKLDRAKDFEKVEVLDKVFHNYG